MAHHLTEEHLEQRTNALLRDLEVARDPVAYRQRYHQRSAQPAPPSREKEASPNNTSSATASSSSFPPRLPATVAPFLLTALSIVLGILVGSLLSLHLF